MKKYIVLVSIVILISGCATTNPAYKNLEKSPCACFEIESEHKNV